MFSFNLIFKFSMIYDYAIIIVISGLGFIIVILYLMIFIGFLLAYSRLIVLLFTLP